MRCIFCNNEKPESEEHIIPQNIGGTVIITDVCKCCNDIFGHEVDCQLIKNRYIYDAYKSMGNMIQLDLKFEFKDAFYNTLNGIKIKASKRSDEEKTLITKIGDNNFIIDKNDTSFITKYLSSKMNELPNDQIDLSVKNYLEWHSQPRHEQYYKDGLFGFDIEEINEDVKYNNLMEADTPHRFIAKACAEFANLFGIDSKIENLSIIKSHALHGDRLNEITLFQEIHTDIKAIPFHVIYFEDSQFIIGLFAQVYYGLKILWNDNSPVQLRFANNLKTKKLVYCKEVNNRLVSTEREYSK